MTLHSSISLLCILPSDLSWPPARPELRRALEQVPSVPDLCSLVAMMFVVDARVGSSGCSLLTHPVRLRANLGLGLQGQGLPSPKLDPCALEHQQGEGVMLAPAPWASVSPLMY